MAVKKEKLVDMYRTMVRIREFEDRVAKEFAAGHILGWVHLSQGQEAVATGTCANLRSDDYITSNHRGHGHLIAKGVKTDRLMAELYGKRTGCNKGKGGTCHIVDIGIGVVGANAIVGAGIPIATGAALSAQMRGTDQVAVSFFSDGAVNQARFHEGINLASIWKLPVVYIIENNMLAEITPISKTCNLPNLADRACAYGILGKTVDGNDVLATYEAVGEGVARARKGEGPSIVECKTYRQRPMAEGSTEHRTKGEKEEIMKMDPIPRFREKLIKMGILTPTAVDKIHQEALQEIDKAVKFAEESPFPEAEETLEDVYSQGGKQ